MDIQPFREYDFYAILGQMIPSSLDAVRKLEPYITKATNAATLRNKKGEILMIGGVADMWQGVGEAWALISPQGLRSPVALRKAADIFLMQSKPNYWRIQATVPADFGERVRWALSLGFSFDGNNRDPMRGYGPDGSDYYMMAIKGSRK